MFKVAILGCENSHANIFLNALYNDKLVTDVEIVGVYGYDPIDTNAAQKLHEKFGVYVAENYDEFVGKVDGVIITARHGDHHYKYAKPYIEAGIPMFIDKPITCTEEDAKAFMAELKAHNVPVCGGSVFGLAPYVNELKKAVADGTYGKVFGGFTRAPMNLDNPYGSFFFYTQHLVQATMDIFGYCPKSVQAFPREKVYTCILRYEDYDVSMEFVNLDMDNVYYVGISCEKGYVGESVEFTTADWNQEFLEFHELLLGKPQKKSYEDFFSPVYVLNAIHRSLESGKEEPINF